MAFGLLIAGAWGYATAYAILLGVMLALVHRRARDELFFLIAMNIAFPLMRGAVPLIRGARRYDDVLLSIDHHLTGANVAVWAERFVAHALTEFMSVCYILFFPLLYFSLLRYFFWHKERLSRFYAGLFTIYGIGFLGYLWVPAAGPYLAFPGLFHAHRGRAHHPSEPTARHGGQQPRRCVSEPALRGLRLHSRLQLPPPAS